MLRCPTSTPNHLSNIFFGFVRKKPSFFDWKNHNEIKATAPLLTAFLVEILKAVHAWMLLGILIQDAVAAAFKRFSLGPMTTVQSIAKHKEKCSKEANQSSPCSKWSCFSDHWDRWKWDAWDALSVVRTTLKWHQHDLAEKVTDRQVVGCFSGSGHERYLWRWIVECYSMSHALDSPPPTHTHTHSCIHVHSDKAFVLQSLWAPFTPSQAPKLIFPKIQYRLR